jgi:hypothetical protein
VEGLMKPLWAWNLLEVHRDRHQFGDTKQFGWKLFDRYWAGVNWSFLKLGQKICPNATPHIVWWQPNDRNRSHGKA